MDNKEFLMRLFDVSVIAKNFDYRNPELGKITNPYQHEFAFDYSVGVTPIPGQPLLSVFSIIRVFADKEKKNQFGTLELALAFEILNLAKFTDEKGIFIPEEALFTMITTAIGTVRGVFCVEMKSSPFPNLVLPLVQIKPLVEDLKRKFIEGYLRPVEQQV